MPNEKIYIHELVEIIGANRSKYMHHMTAGFADVRDEHEQTCIGVWAEVGTTGNWPRVVNMWEHDGWDGLAFHLGFEASGKKTNQTTALGAMEPAEAAWWTRATEFRSGGRDRILLPTPWTRTADELVAEGVRGALYLHERAWTQPDRSQQYLSSVGDAGIPAYKEHGIELVGAYDNALINGREAFVLWAVPDWATWASFERAWHGAGATLMSMREDARSLIDRFERRLLTDSPLNPMVIGRQPALSDLRPFDEL